MFGKKSPSNDLTSAEAVAKSQKVYDRVSSGKAKNATNELNKTHGKTK
jgi:hypothetical protein